MCVLAASWAGEGKAGGVGADRPLHDLAPMFEGLRASFEKLTRLGADYERKFVDSEEHQRAFVQSKAAYLDGLQTHMLGDSEPSVDSVAGKIFRKCAYVADTFNPKTTHTHTLL